MLSVNCFRRFPAVCYPTVEDIRKALLEKALSGNSTLKKENTNVITHMITSGEHAGEIEVLNYQAEADGLRVHFTSMSPVCVAYQAGASSAVTITVGDTTSQSGSNPATGAAGGQTLPVLLWGGALVMALAVPKKRK